MFANIISVLTWECLDIGQKLIFVIVVYWWWELAIFNFKNHYNISKTLYASGITLKTLEVIHYIIEVIYYISWNIFGCQKLISFSKAIWSCFVRRTGIPTSWYICVKMPQNSNLWQSIVLIMYYNHNFITL